MAKRVWKRNPASTVYTVRLGENMHAYLVGFAKGPSEDTSKENKKKAIIQIKGTNDS